MKSNIKRVSRETLRERVYAEVRDALMAGQFKPGEPLRLQAVADAVGTSITPVREALRRLVAERALVFTESRAMLVPFPSRDEFHDILETRLQLEPFATTLATTRLTPEDFDELNLLQRKMVSAKQAVDYLKFNQQFHFRIYRAADRATLMSLIESLWLHIGPLLNHLIASAATVPGASQELPSIGDLHLEIIEALRRRDPTAAGKAVAEDIASAGHTIDQLLAQLAEASKATDSTRRWRKGKA